MNTFRCPHCEKEIELSEAITHKFKEEGAKEQEEKHKIEIEKVRKDAQILAEKEAKQKSQKELDLNKSANQKLEQELQLLKKQKEEDEKNRKEAEERIKDEAIKEAQKEQYFKLKEKDLMIEQARKMNDDLKRKLEQSSQQRQGEVLELDLEEKLKNLFPNDEFLPVPKGFEGADIWQKVKYKSKIVGSIIWETKRTKAWSNGWTVKLKEDAAKISASEAILVSFVLPNGVSNFDRKDGVWITSYEHAISICRYVRFLITMIWTTKGSAGQTEEEWGLIRDYMMSDSFKHKMTTHFDGIKALRDGLDAEKRSTILRWKKTEGQIDKLDNNTLNFYGELKAIAPNIPEIKGIDSSLADNEGSLEENPLDE